MDHYSWEAVISILYIFIFILIAKLIKEKLHIFRSIIIPTPLLAGFLGLIAGPGVLGLLNYDFHLYETVVFHAMAIGFISLTLTESKVERKGESLTYGLFCVSTYLFQALIGFGTAFVLLYFIPGLFPGLGLMLPLAYGQGPGFAQSIGASNWADVVDYAAQYGLSLATLGFVWGGLGGVIILNYYVRKYNLKKYKLNQLEGIEEIKSINIEMKSPKEINFFDMLTVQFTLIGVVYALSFYLIELIAKGLANLGGIGVELGDSLRGMNFVFGIMFAILLNQFIKYLSKKSSSSKVVINSYMQSNISALAFTVMITASVMAIDINRWSEYWLLLLVISLVGGIATLLFVTYFTKRVYRSHHIEHVLALFGTFTGTASTGIALLRGIDPDLESGVAEEIAIGSAVALPLAFPLIILLAFPEISFETGNPFYYYLVAGLFFLYLVLLMSILFFRMRRYKISNQ